MSQFPMVLVDGPLNYGGDDTPYYDNRGAPECCWAWACGVHQLPGCLKRETHIMTDPSTLDTWALVDSEKKDM